MRQFSLGQNRFDTHLDLDDFVTYVRKENLKYDQNYYEKFVLVFIAKGSITIIPFDWFNKSGGDYGYVWPATAQFEKEKNKLYGRGMRMSNFVIDIESVYRTKDVKHFDSATISTPIIADNCSTT